ncbi:site-specific integrase [Candidatus Pacearchaeota archaeon]|nr:site-specific integrase [Candidatus Pacearchaeota archaeon]
MGIYRRVYCLLCKKNFELRQEASRVTCKRCGNEINVTEKNSAYYIEYRCENRRYREKIGYNKKFAQMVLNKRKIEIAENKFLDKKKVAKIRFSEMIEKYIEMYLKVNRPTWWKSEKHNLRHLNMFFGEKCLHEITTLDVEKFKIKRMKIVGKNSVNKNLGCLRAMFNKAKEWDLFRGENPVHNKQLFKLENRRLRYLEKDEISRLLSCCEGYLKDIVEFAINTGMRQGEIFNLKWEDVDFNTGLIHLLKTKSGNSREIPMNESVKNVLHRVKRPLGAVYVFSSYNNKPFSNITRSFKTALEKAGIKNFRFHDLRHTFASHLVMAGVDLLTVKELLGHKTIEMTLRYSHLSGEHKMKAVQTLEKINLD